MGEVQDVYPEEVVPYSVTLSYQKINTLIGTAIAPDTVKNILDSLDMEIVSETEDTLSSRVPVYRIDVRRDVDVIEDILRMYGYNNVAIGEQLHSTLSYNTPTDAHYQLETLISEQLCGSGFSAIVYNSLTRQAYYDWLTTYPAAHCVALMNPLSADLNVMRQTLLFGGLQSIEYNRKRQQPNLRFFEFGNCYYFVADEQQEDTVLSGYNEEYRLGLLLSGRRPAHSWAHAN